MTCFHFPRTPLLPVLCAYILLFSCELTPRSEVPQRDKDFNDYWHFHRGDRQNAWQVALDDSGWDRVDLPHDWSVEDGSVRDSLHVGPFFKNLESGADVGYLPGGTGWYRKHFVLDNEPEERVYLHFDGIQTESRIWVNDSLVHAHKNGYTPIYLDITPHLSPRGLDNLVAVEVVNPDRHSRWFTGSGIYRPVRMSRVGPVHILPWGITVQTPVVGKNKAVVQVGVDFRSPNGSHTVSVDMEITDPLGRTFSIRGPADTLLSGTDHRVNLQAVLPDPLLWSTHQPHLHTLRVRLWDGNRILDESSVRFGIRSLDFSAGKGFLLNGEPVLLKGACIHHDNGLLGSMAFADAEHRRVLLLKENGFNAIRTSHNPPSESFLEACDELGMLVIDEAFDMWEVPKRERDYHRHFAAHWRDDLTAMIRRDRNHPSVILWSFGNEIPERALPEGLAWADTLISFIRTLDATRPVTQAICGFWDNPDLEWADAQPAFDLLDVGGYNYLWSQYEEDHALAPGRVMFGSETFPLAAWENWQKTVALPYVIGDFVWTGMDYIGESGIGHAELLSAADKPANFLMPWPWYVSWCGDLDITGEKKPQSRYRDVVWGESLVEILVHEPVPEGQREQVFHWGWPLERKSWTWEVPEGQIMDVAVYSGAEEVELFLNGRSLGRKPVHPEEKGTVRFKVPFAPGTLRATAYQMGQEVDGDTLFTAGPLDHYRLVPEQETVRAHRQRLVYVRVEACDASGRVLPDAEPLLRLGLQGPAELLAAGNGSPMADGSMQDEAFRLFRGKGLIILRSTGITGDIVLEVEDGTSTKKATAHLPAVAL
ncbi:MAG: glycoside hydrolase family 2 TIM barrel-domain containing protein [Bacteroidales bacterium]